MPATRHPLRPLEGSVLVCEGESDFTFLTGIFSRFLFNINVYEAGGVQNVNALRNILDPAVSVRDRDFQVTYFDAQNSLKPGDPRTYWPRFDIEAYLLYEDWMLSVLSNIQSLHGFLNIYVPANTNDIEQDILSVATAMVPFHAGSQTVQDLNNLSEPYKLRAVISPHAETLRESDWRSHLVGEGSRLQREANEIAGSSNLSQSEIEQRFNDNSAHYQTWAAHLDTIRNHFSGKQILSLLAQRWQSNTKGAKYSWETFRDELIVHAIKYSQSIVGYLSDDSRLGDIGLLASKILGRKV